MSFALILETLEFFVKTQFIEISFALLFLLQPWQSDELNRSSDFGSTLGVVLRSSIHWGVTQSLECGAVCLD